MALFGFLRNASSSKEGKGKSGRGGKNGKASRKTGKGPDANGPSLMNEPSPLPFPIPDEVKWLIRQWDWDAAIAGSLALYKRFMSLPRQTQSLLSWGFLVFAVVFISGLWMLKLGLLAFLLLFRPFQHPDIRVERLAGAQKKGKKGKEGSKARKGMDLGGFSDDPLISALQRIPETYTYGNVAPRPSKTPSPNPSRKASCAAVPQCELPALVAQPSHPSSLESTNPSGTPPMDCVPLPLPGSNEPPPSYDTVSSIDSRLSRSSGRGSPSPALGLGPAPITKNRSSNTVTTMGNRAVTAPVNAQNYRHSRPASYSSPPPPAISSMTPAHFTPLQPHPSTMRRPPAMVPSRQASSATILDYEQVQHEQKEDESELTEWERQQRLIGSRHKSASFHRVEQAQKFFSRKFSRGGGGAADGSGTMIGDAGADELR